jgi:WAS family protein 1
VYNRIEVRVNTEKNRLENLKLRISTCQEKVSKIKGSTNATTIFSTAKFPATKILAPYDGMFNNIEVCNFLKNDMLFL